MIVNRIGPIAEAYPGLKTPGYVTEALRAEALLPSADEDPRPGLLP